MASIVQYNPNDSLIPYRVTKYKPFANTPDYIGLENTLINPDLSKVGQVESDYWKYDVSSSSIIPFSESEREVLKKSVPITLNEIVIPPLTEGHSWIINKNREMETVPPKDRQRLKSSEPWSTNSTDWELVDGLLFTTKNIVKATFDFTINFTAKSTSNNTEFQVGVFIDGTLSTDATRTIAFKDKDDTKSITFISYIENVEPNSLIEVKIKRSADDRNGYITIDNRTFIIEEE